MKISIITAIAILAAIAPARAGTFVATHPAFPITLTTQPDPVDVILRVNCAEQNVAYLSYTAPACAPENIGRTVDLAVSVTNVVNSDILYGDLPGQILTGQQQGDFDIHFMEGVGGLFGLRRMVCTSHGLPVCTVPYFWEVSVSGPAFGNIPVSEYIYTLSEVPLPAAAGLFLAGLGLLAARRYRLAASPHRRVR